MFQSTRPRGARPPSRAPWIARLCCFNPRARAGRDQPESLETPDSGGFNPRARAGRDKSAWTSAAVAELFQSTRPRGARPQTDGRRRVRTHVSIHAPARGATEVHRQVRAPAGFQSTRPRGARRWRRAGRGVGRWFQSTRPRGARHPEPGELRSAPGVSIHAPARGATVRPGVDCGTHRRFNPRARAGRDAVTERSRPCRKKFQSTRPRGARPDDGIRRIGLRAVSIHAPARGATC